MDIFLLRTFVATARAIARLAAHLPHSKFCIPAHFSRLHYLVVSSVLYKRQTVKGVADSFSELKGIPYSFIPKLSVQINFLTADIHRSFSTSIKSSLDRNHYF